MISIEDMTKFNYISDEVLVSCTNGQVVVGKIDSVDDEEESGLGEPGISMFTPDGRYLGIGQSEILTIELMNTRSISFAGLVET